MTKSLAALSERSAHVHAVLADAVVEDRDAGVYRANRRIFTDEELFELEMKHIFEGNWIYLAHESQLPEPGDYFTTYIGRQPVVITRDKQGELHCLVNACAHRGAMICRRKTDNRPTLTCPFHGWTFRNDGTLLKVKDPDGAGYPDSFDTDDSHNMTKVARFEGYRGFLFGSLNPDVLSLEEHLGDTTKVIDMLVDQSPDGLEVLRGSSTYTYDGNWKVQAENGADGYHVTATHWNYAATTSRRGTGDSANDTKTLDAGSWGKSGGGYWSYPNGHLCLWTWAGNPQDRPLWDRMEELKEKYGEDKGEFMVRGSRNLCLYPNVYLMDQFSTQIRLRPIAPDKTEVTIYCIAPKGESAAARAWRIRQYEDFFNASGMATPDDLEEFRSCQLTFRATAAPWNDMSRGAEHWLDGPDPVAESLGMTNVISAGVKNEDEGLYPRRTAFRCTRGRPNGCGTTPAAVPDRWWSWSPGCPGTRGRTGRHGCPRPPPSPPRWRTGWPGPRPRPVRCSRRWPCSARTSRSRRRSRSPVARTRSGFSTVRPAPGCCGATGPGPGCPCATPWSPRPCLTRWGRSASRPCTGPRPASWSTRPPGSATSSPPRRCPTPPWPGSSRRWPSSVPPAGSGRRPPSCSPGRLGSPTTAGAVRTCWPARWTRSSAPVTPAAPPPWRPRSRACGRRRCATRDAGPRDYEIMRVPSCLARAAVAEARADYAGVLRALEPLRQPWAGGGIDEPGTWPWADVYANALVLQCCHEEAGEFLGPQERLAEQRGHRSARARLGYARGRLLGATGDLAAARACFEDALRLLADLPLRHDRARGSFAYGQTLRRAGKRAEADAVLQTARDLYLGLGATTYVERCDRELRAGGVHLVRGEREVDDLTPQERLVSALVARGMTNREVASELFVSVKTVQYHLTRIYAKLGIRSRSELAALRGSISGD